MGVSHFESGRWKDILRKNDSQSEIAQQIYGRKSMKMKGESCPVCCIAVPRNKSSWAMDIKVRWRVRGKTWSGRGRSATLGRTCHMTYCKMYWYVATYWGFLLISFPKHLSSKQRLWHIICNVQDGHCLCNSYCLMTAWLKGWKI